ncbi:WYL domain-containing protein [Streptomyces sp. NBC_00847]|uniref:WYL domain-containing protein n=1 Tax=Streptomyces sp. NBC_00847 TaxID=2975850 RepID=UPI00225E01B5|nr:WYL domain-containing protein [Streptomyces sp. NBC_00847]MCX4885841.1 WYL domain-containing protein [Streptomyces sp. NBC_00847]
MRITANQKSTKTLADLYRAIDRQQAVTLTFVDTDGTETIRTVEPWELRTTKNGRIQLRAGCRLRGDARSFAVDQIKAYTLHRIGFVLERTEATSTTGHGIVVRSTAQLIARELGRDYLPTRRITRDQTDLAA